MVELLGVSRTDPKVVEAKPHIRNAVQVRYILSKMHPDGYWPYVNRKTGETKGIGTVTAFSGA